MLQDFASETIATGDTGIFVRWGGAGPPLLLLHGFPQTHLMWRAVAPHLARRFTVVCADPHRRRRMIDPPRRAGQNAARGRKPPPGPREGLNPLAALNAHLEPLCSRAAGLSAVMHGGLP